MAESFKDKVEDAGHKIAEKATRRSGTRSVRKWRRRATGRRRKPTRSATGSTRPRKRSSTRPPPTAPRATPGPSARLADIREHQEVYASCGRKIGTVDRVEGDQIKLAKNDSPDGLHHLIPTSWVAKVHDHIHLSKNSQEVESQWQPA